MSLSSRAQPAILAPPPPHARSLTYRVAPDTDVRAALARFRDACVIDASGGARAAELPIVGFGAPLVHALGRNIGGLRTFPGLSGASCSVPSTQQAVWVLLRGEERSTIFDAHQRLAAWLGEAFVLADQMDVFVYAGGRDLTGYEDGTENPRDSAAEHAALVEASHGEGMRGSSFVAVQRWVHDLARFAGFDAIRRDLTIGRKRDDNQEIADAPPSAHVKRSAQESFEPAAFMLRRSMPFAEADTQGLEFIAFGESLDRFERVLRRMVGLDDDVVDALFSFSRPVCGGYYWCPPVADGRLDLTAIL